MTQKEFETLVNSLIEYQKAVLFVKGKDYSNDEDRLSNFKEIAKFQRTSPEEVWSSFLLKPICAIFNYLRTGQSTSESIEDRFSDAINYLLLGYALIKENKEIHINSNKLES